MLQELKKALALGYRLTHFSKKRVEDEINLLVRAGIIDGKEGKKMFEDVLREAAKSGRRVADVASQEARRFAKATAPARKRAVSVLKRRASQAASHLVKGARSASKAARKVVKHRSRTHKRAARKKKR